MVRAEVVRENGHGSGHIGRGVKLADVRFRGLKPPQDLGDVIAVAVDDPETHGHQPLVHEIEQDAGTLIKASSLVLNRRAGSRRRPLKGDQVCRYTGAREHHTASAADGVAAVVAQVEFVVIATLRADERGLLDNEGVPYHLGCVVCIRNLLHEGCHEPFRRRGAVIFAAFIHNLHDEGRDAIDAWIGCAGVQRCRRGRKHGLLELQDRARLGELQNKWCWCNNSNEADRWGATLLWTLSWA